MSQRLPLRSPWPLPAVHVFIEPALVQRFGAEIHSTWRYVLAGAGFAWKPAVAPDEHCDVAFVRDPATSSATVTVTAEPDKWVRRRGLRFQRTCDCGGTVTPRFAGEADQVEVLRRSDSRVEYRRDVLFDVFWLLTGQDEHQWPRYAHGFTDLSGAPAHRRDLLTTGLASSLAVGLGDTIAEGCGMQPVPRWPDGKRAAAAGSHDVDYPQAVRWLEPARVLARRGVRHWREALAVATGARHHWQFGQWMAFESRLGFRSAFYFTARRGSLVRRALGTPDPFYDISSAPFQRLFAELVERGFEIGLHSSYRACESDDAIRIEKARLEDAAGVEILGSRHHYWRLLPDDPAATLRQQERAGLEYDASLTFDRYLGWRRGSTWPFFPFDATLGRDLETLQMPTAWMDDQLFGMAAFNPGEPSRLLRREVETVAAQGGCLLVDMHEYVYDDALFPGWAATYQQLFEHLSERGDFWLASPATIARHWRQRHDAILQASAGLGLPDSIQITVRPTESSQPAVIEEQNL